MINGLMLYKNYEKISSKELIFKFDKKENKN